MNNKMKNDNIGKDFHLNNKRNATKDKKYVGG